MSGADIETRAAMVPAVLSGWLAYLAVDFLSHAVLLASWWRATEPYWLPPTDLFRRIPFAYGAFAIYVASLMWLLVRLAAWRANLAKTTSLSAAIGLIFGSVTALANYSVFAMPASALIVWPASVMLASIAAGTAGCWTLRSARPWRRVLLVFAAAMVLFLIGVLLQNVFFPTPESRTR